VASVAEVKALLEQASDHLREIYRILRNAHHDMEETVRSLDEVSRDHHESLLPPGFLKAKERFPEQLELTVRTLERVQRLSVEL
jgi:phosphate uptake regulator